MVITGKTTTVHGNRVLGEEMYRLTEGERRREGGEATSVYKIFLDVFQPNKS
jgi:hypothetical protein